MTSQSQSILMPMTNLFLGVAFAETGSLYA